MSKNLKFFSTTFGNAECIVTQLLVNKQFYSEDAKLEEIQNEVEVRGTNYEDVQINKNGGKNEFVQK